MYYENFQNAVKNLKILRQKLEELGFDGEWIRLLTYSDSTSPVYSICYSKKFKLDEIEYDKLRGDNLTDKYVNFVADIVKEYMECDITDSDYGFCQITGKDLDKSSQLWGMDFMEKDKSKSYIFIRCEICINKTLASNYKKDYLKQSPLIGERKIPI